MCLQAHDLLPDRLPVLEFVTRCSILGPVSRQLTEIAYLTALVLAPVSAVEEAALDFKLAGVKPVMEVAGIREASGLAVSRTDSGFFWVVNDSGSSPEIHLIDSNGRSRGQVTLKGARNKDWEDLASFTMDGVSYLLVADHGDNNAQRDICSLYLLREPSLPPPGANLSGEVPTDREIRFRYEGGPRDCEAVAVDVVAKKILLLSKRTQPPELYELPLIPTAADGTLIARKIGSSAVSAPMDSMVPYRNQPTGMDIAADQSFAAVVTYYGVFLFPKTPAESWSNAFSRKPVMLAPHILPQAESIAISDDGNDIVVVSEGRKSPIIRYRKTKRPTP